MQFEVEGEIGKYYPHIIQTKIKKNGNLDKKEIIYISKGFKNSKTHGQIISFALLNVSVPIFISLVVILR